MIKVNFYDASCSETLHNFYYDSYGDYLKDIPSIEQLFADEGSNEEDCYKIQMENDTDGTINEVGSDSEPIYITVTTIKTRPKLRVKI